MVKEERRLRTDDRPRSLVYESLMAAAFKVHPYRGPIIGWMNDLEIMTADDVRDWYARWYAPNNAILVVVGDVSAAEVFALAETHYGAIPTRASCPTRKPQDEPAQRGARRRGREGAGGAAVPPDGVQGAGAAGPRAGPGALRARGARRGARRQRIRAAEAPSGARAADRGRSRRELRGVRARSRRADARRRPAAGPDGRRARSGAARRGGGDRRPTG